jgi:hypothetical protein
MGWSVNFRQAFGEGANCNMEIDFSLLRGTRHSYRIMQVEIFHANAQEQRK